MYSDTVPLQTIASLALLVSVIGSCANVVVLTVLTRARRQFSSSTHTLITNQSAMDLAATLSATITSVIMFAHGYKYGGGNRILDSAICIIFEKHRGQGTWLFGMQ